MKKEANYLADVVQFMMPDGRQVETGTHLPESTHADYNDMRQHGYRFEAEMLQTGEISATISGKGRDADIGITSNGPAVQAGMVAMLGRRLWLPQKKRGNPVKPPAGDAARAAEQKTQAAIVREIVANPWAEKGSAKWPAF